MFQRSIRSRVTILLPLLATISCALLLWIVQHIYIDYLRTTIGRQQFQAVTLVADEIDRKLAANHALLQAFTASLPPRLLKQPREALRILRSHADLMTVFTNGMFLLDRQGRIVAELPLGVSRTGFDLSFRDYFQQTMQTGKPYLSEPYRSLVSGKPAVMFTAPILSAEGEPLGMFGASVNLTLPSFLGSITTTRLGKTGYMFLFSRDRTMILHPDPSRIMQKDIPEGKNRLLDRAILGFEGFGETVNTRGLHALTSFRSLRYKDWILGANYPKAEIYAPVRRIEQIFSLLVLPTLLLVFGGLHLYLRRMTTPLQQFADHVEQIHTREGDLRFFPTVRLLEVDAIGRSFNQLLQELDRRQEETALQASKFRLIFDQAGDLVFICTEDTAILEANQEAIRVLGHPAEQLENMSLLMLTAPGHLQNMQEQMALVRSTGQAIFEAALFTTAGTTLPVEVSARLIHFNSQPIILTIIRDISDRKKSEQDLRTRNDFLLALHETTLSLLQRQESSSLLEAIVSRAARLMHTEHAYLFMVDPESNNLRLYVRMGLYRNLSKTTLEPGQGVAGRVWQTRKPVWVEDYRQLPNRLDDPALDVAHGLTGLPLTDGDKVVGVIGIAYTDPAFSITEEQVAMLSRFAELASLTLHNARLYRAIQTELDERKRLESHLRHAQRMEAVGMLAGGVAHDFNNVLTVIIGYAGMMQMKLAENDPLRTGAEKILAAAERAASLTRSLLSFSRKQTLNMQPADLNRIVGSSTILLERLMGARHRLEYRLFPEPLPVTADSVQLEQVIINLAINARDAMPDGGTVTIQTGYGNPASDENHAPAPGAYAFFSVADHGTGMDEATVQKIFEPFFTTKEAGQGTGLGLAIAYNIVQLHGGLISCQSTTDQGTLFTVHLPLSVTRTEWVNGVEATAMPRGTEVLLLAEDSEETRDITRRVLEEFGYTVIQASDGIEAVTKYRQYQEVVALLLLDLSLPHMTGGQVYGSVREINPQAKVLFTSAHQEKELTALLPEGARFLQKPYKPATLLYTVREVLSR